MAKKDEDSTVQTVLESFKPITQTKHITVIGVCGFAGAGKTTLCQALVQNNPERVLRLDCDRFSAFSHTERATRIRRARASGNAMLLNAEENPMNWYDWDGILSAIQCLRLNRKFETNRAWNRETGELDAPYKLSTDSDDQVVVLCDCIFLLHKPVRTWLDGTLLVDCRKKALASRRKCRSKSAVLEHEAWRRYELFEAPYFEEHTEQIDAIFNSEIG